MMLRRRKFLQASAGAAIGSVLLAASNTAAGPARKRRVLYFTRCQGFVHGPVMRPGGKADELAPSEKWMHAMAAKHGFDVTCTKEGRVFDGDIGAFDVIVFYTSGDLSQPIPANSKDPPSSPISPEGKQRLLAAIEAGKGFMGIHSATDSYRTPRDQCDPYIAMLGGEFLSHGAQQEATMKVGSPTFPGLEDLKDFRLFEEWYSHIKLAKDLHVILVQDTQGMQGWQYERPPYPATWARAHGRGRVFYTSLVHSEKIFELPVFEKIFVAGFRWAAGDAAFAPTPNIAQVCPGADRSPEPPAGPKKAKGKEKRR